ncbi:hypothetical protein TL16_g02060 [Triparma laevis f. inornata]|uniref:Protein DETOXIFICATION n=1 Tax=Triparma laevis f. inornata TaxID=1714386 RepID=A0A9W6ZUD1_9STRA|nr:hypothetical protein TL16_g02060 [Triparma laevis f. inornata]
MPEQASSASGSRGVGSRLKSHAIDQAISDIYEGFELDYSHWTKQQFLSIFAVIGLAFTIMRLRNRIFGTATVTVAVATIIISSAFIHAFIPPLPRHTHTHLHLGPKQQPQPPESETSSSTSSTIINLALPTLATLSIDPLLSFTDTYFASYADTTITTTNALLVDNLASVSTAAPAVNFVLFLFNGVLGTSVVPSVVARERGEIEAKYKSQSQSQIIPPPPSTSAQLTLKLAFQSGVVLALTSLPLLYLLSPSQNLPQLLPILTVRALTLPFTFSLTTSLSILRGYLDTTTPFKVLTALGALNLLLSYALTHYFTNISGGLAVISATCFCEIVGTNERPLLRRLPKARRYFHPPPKLPTLPPTSQSLLNSVVKRGTSSSFVRSFMLQSFILSSACVTSNFSENENAISSHQVACLIWFLSSFAVDAIGSAAQTLVAEEIGREGNPISKANVALELGVKAGGLLLVAATVFCYGFDGVAALTHNDAEAGGLLLVAATVFCYGFDGVAALTHNDAEVMEGVASVLPIVVLCQPLNGAVFVADGVLQGANEFDYEAKAMATSVAFAVTFIALAEGLGLDGTTLVHVWEGMAILQASRAITTLARIKGFGGIIKSCF